MLYKQSMGNIDMGHAIITHHIQVNNYHVFIEIMCVV